MIKAIVYTSNTGNTERYAKLLGHQLDLPVYTLNDAKKTLERNTAVIYMGWIMAGGIKGYKNAKKYFCVRMVCAVGMGATGTQLQEIKDNNQIPASIAVFTLQGGFDMQKLRGVNRMMMNIMMKTAGKALAEKKERTSDEDDMLDLMMNGGSRVSMENLFEPIQWYEQVRDLI
ncbi:MAG: flavodoxin domain-containing protein [Lachnospiraceae bacterium]|nr:flavodoxin domain-containing protein [Lachnospiraceae bacterium]